MTYYMIRNKITGAHLPTADYHNKTRQELSSTKPPRLFINKGTATQCLNWWVKGVSYTIDEYNHETRFWETRLTATPKPHRKLEDMEVIPVSLFIRPFSWEKSWRWSSELGKYEQLETIQQFTGVKSE